jgi:large repetitive protein
VRIADGDKLETGFGTGYASVLYRRLHQSLFVGVWAEIRNDCGGKGDKGDNPFPVKVNGSIVPLTACSTAAGPGGTAIARIGVPAHGFWSALSSIDVAVAGKSLLTLPCASTGSERRCVSSPTR